MGDNIQVRFRVEYKGKRDDVDTPHPINVTLVRGSSVIDLLNNAAHLHPDFGFTSRYVPGIGDLVGSFCSILNEEEPGFKWVFYSPAQHCISMPLGKAKLSIGEEVVARYEKIEEWREDQKAQLGLLQKDGH